MAKVAMFTRSCEWVQIGTKWGSDDRGYRLGVKGKMIRHRRLRAYSGDGKRI
jgi:hypothetical protein